MAGVGPISLQSCEREERRQRGIQEEGEQGPPGDRATGSGDYKPSWSRPIS